MEKRDRVPRIGTIKHPKDGDHFEVPPEIEAVFGKDPKRLDIMLHSENVDEIYRESYQRFGGKVKWCYGVDGVGHELLDVKEGKRKERKCPCEHLESKKCQLTCMFNVAIPSVSLAGVYSIFTKGYNSRAIIHTAIANVKKYYGRIEGVPLILSRVPIIVGGNGHRRQMHILHLAPTKGTPLQAPLREEQESAEETDKKPVGTMVADGVRYREFDSTPEQPAAKKEQPEKVPCKEDPAAGPMAPAQILKLNQLMAAKGMLAQDRKKFFDFVLGDKTKNFVFANAFISRFEEHHKTWTAKGRQ